MASVIPKDYLERVYAGVLGKLIGVYLGRPFEGWTHQRIMEVLGPIRYYVHDHPDIPTSPWDPSSTPSKEKMPLVVTDDDVSGTFTFVRALEEHGFNPDITSEQIGKTWLNQIIEGQTILWWGGKGVSTEHTAYLNLKNGIPAPHSGSMETNGKTVAEQIGAQIFIDGWAMVAPGNPKLAARLAQRAGSVSHDGESVYAGMLWAAMEAESFLTKDVDHLLDTGLSVIPPNSAISGLVADVRQWHSSDGDCADGGFSTTTATNIALEVANIGRRIAGLQPLEAPKGGAQFHFTLPGSLQGFMASDATLAHEYDELANPHLAIKCQELKPSNTSAEALTQVFMGRDVSKMHSYPLMASPLLYPGQTVEARVRSPDTNTTEVQVALRLKIYGPKDMLVVKTNAPVILSPGKSTVLKWTIPDDFDSQPIQSVGLGFGAVEENFTGKIILDSLGWTGVPSMTLKRPSDKTSHFWNRAWVNGVDSFYSWMKPSFCIVKNRGEGILIHGTRDWTDYRATVTGFTVQLGQPAGVAIRVRGLNRYYAMMFSAHGSTVTLVKALDEKRIVMASANFSWQLDQAYEVIIEAKGPHIVGRVGGTELKLMAEDDQYVGGGLGLVVTDGTMSAGHIQIEPLN
ncbi:hypothetical protein VMCG_05333 [Cytospora schulzeri]|uniref:Uncharacterized protein n=1 Tax=Cytospora schulzeri TaxID=448051 RepID=A0A423WK01_9PEZI|nr:hypothetical protein VMCG_05333 [Valsa malicola]